MKTSAQIIDGLLVECRERESRVLDRLKAAKVPTAKAACRLTLKEIRAEYAALSSAMDAFELLRTAKKSMMEEDDLFPKADEIFDFLKKHTGDGTHEVSP